MTEEAESIGRSAADDSVGDLLKTEKREEYGKLCDAVHARLTHSYLAACIVWEILEFLPRVADKLLPDERELLLTLATNAADRVVVTVVALTETDPGTLNFGALSAFLRTHCDEGSTAVLRARLKDLKLKKRRSGLLAEAQKTRHQLVAHFDREQALGLAGEDRRLLIEDVLTLQDEAQEIFDGLRVDRTIGFAPRAAISRRMLHLLAEGHGDLLDGESKSMVREMLAPGTTLPDSPWQFGRPPSMPE